MRLRLLQCSVLLCFVCMTLCGAEATLPVPSNLKPDGVPPIPAALYSKLERYGASRSATLLDWHPNRREMIVSTRFGDTPQIHSVSMPNGARMQLTFFADRVTQGAFNPANQFEVLFEKDSGGDEFYQIYLMNTRSGDISLVTDGGRTRNVGMKWSRSGRSIAWTSNKRDGKDSDIWIADPHVPSGARILLETKEPGWSVSDWSADDDFILATLYKSAVESELYLIEVGTGKSTKLAPMTGKGSLSHARLTHDGKGIYMTSNVDGDFEQLAYLDIATHKMTLLRPDLKRDVADVVPCFDDKYLAYTVNEDGYEKLHVWDVAAKRDRPDPALPAGLVYGLVWRPGMYELGVTVASAHTPGDVFSINVEKNSVERWTYSETGGLNAGDFSEPKLIHWKSFDGLSISGFLYPASSKFHGPRPVIINIHGGPEGQSQPGYQGAGNYLMQELGITVIYPNVRGSTGYGKRFLNLDNGIKREDSVKDIGALLDWIRTQKDLDASRIMVTGGSYGGYMTLSSMTHYSDQVKCAVEVVGISNFRTFLEHTEAYRRDLRRAEYGDERDPTMRDFFETISPLNNAAKITKPMFVVAGRNDPRVPWTEGRQMTDALRKNNVPTWFLVAEDEGHGFAKKSNRDYQFAATVEFIRRYLLN